MFHWLTNYIEHLSRHSLNVYPSHVEKSKQFITVSMCKKFLQQSFHSGLDKVRVGGKMPGNADILTALKVDTSSIVHSKIKYVNRL